jgi:hypothetical protein
MADNSISSAQNEENLDIDDNTVEKSTTVKTSAIDPEFTVNSRKAIKAIRAACGSKSDESIARFFTTNMHLTNKCSTPKGIFNRTEVTELKRKRMYSGLKQIKAIKSTEILDLDEEDGLGSDIEITDDKTVTAEEDGELMDTVSATNVATTSTAEMPPTSQMINIPLRDIQGFLDPTFEVNFDIGESFFKTQPKPKSGKFSKVVDKSKLPKGTQIPFLATKRTADKKSKNVAMHAYLETCLATNHIPAKFAFNLKSSLGWEDKHFNQEWQQSINKLSLHLIEMSLKQSKIHGGKLRVQFDRYSADLKEACPSAQIYRDLMAEIEEFEDYKVEFYSLKKDDQVLDPEKTPAANQASGPKNQRRLRDYRYNEPQRDRYDDRNNRYGEDRRYMDENPRFQGNSRDRGMRNHDPRGHDNFYDRNHQWNQDQGRQRQQPYPRNRPTTEQRQRWMREDRDQHPTENHLSTSDRDLLKKMLKERKEKEESK